MRVENLIAIPEPVEAVCDDCGIKCTQAIDQSKVIGSFLGVVVTSPLKILSSASGYPCGQAAIDYERLGGAE